MTVVSSGPGVSGCSAAVRRCSGCLHQGGRAGLQNLHLGGRSGSPKLSFLILNFICRSNVSCHIGHMQDRFLATCTPSWWLLLYYHVMSLYVNLQFICTFIRTGHIVELDSTVLYRLQVVFGFSPHQPPRTDVSTSPPRAISLPRSARLPGG